MNIIKLAVIDSTNAYLKKIIASHENLPNFLSVWAENQTNGVGQYGAKWEVEAAKNLTFSMLYQHSKKIMLEDIFLLNMIVSVSVVKILQLLDFEQVSIKWPNDILISKKKVGGILIENTIKNSFVDKSIIGIGLNVNQTNFTHLPKASSLKNIKNSDFDIENILNLIINSLKNDFLDEKNFIFEEIYTIYERFLFQKDKVSTFKSNSGSFFSGIIRKVSKNGHLLVELEDETLKSFALKEIELMY